MKIKKNKARLKLNRTSNFLCSENNMSIPNIKKHVLDKDYLFFALDMESDQRTPCRTRLDKMGLTPQNKRRRSDRQTDRQTSARWSKSLHFLLGEMPAVQGRHRSAF